MNDAAHWQQIYWLGGSPCCGKSTIADLLAERFGWQVYHCDEAFNQHVARAQPQLQPALHRARHIDWNTFWMQPMADQVQNVVDVYTEEFPLILDDLRDLRGPVIAEGTALLPELIAPLQPRHALWMVPTADFQRERYAQRGAWVQAIVAQCAYPDQAWDNWMTRDAITAQQVTTQAQHLGYPVIVVDGQHTLAENAERVAAYFTEQPT
jgi:2-phosphoglycerate kinase